MLVLSAETFTTTAEEPGQASSVVMPADAQQISRNLRIRDAQMRERISASVVYALSTRKPSAVLQREEFAASVGQLIVIRPARETDQVVVTIETLDPGCSPLTAGHVSDLFRLSPSEADIALALFDDETPAAIAQTRGVRLETVRGQIKAILHKVGVTSQKQLLRVFSQVAAAIA